MNDSVAVTTTHKQTHYKQTIMMMITKYLKTWTNTHKTIWRLSQLEIRLKKCFVSWVGCTFKSKTTLATYIHPVKERSVVRAG